MTMARDKWDFTTFNLLQKLASEYQITKFTWRYWWKKVSIHLHNFSTSIAQGTGTFNRKYTLLHIYLHSWEHIEGQSTLFIQYTVIGTPSTQDRTRKQLTPSIPEHLVKKLLWITETKRICKQNQLDKMPSIIWRYWSVKNMPWKKLQRIHTTPEPLHVLHVLGTVPGGTPLPSAKTK
jgi:hypothetical protein